MTAFLHGSIKEEVYVEQPEGFEVHDRESHVRRLKKALYGLKQTLWAWYERIDSYLMMLGFTRSEVDSNLYFKCGGSQEHFWMLFFLGSALISWKSRKQKSIALNTVEAEYIFASMASCEAVWLRKLFSELFGHALDTIVILCDNQSGIRLSKNPEFHYRSKHIDIRYHFFWDMVQRGAIRLHHIETDEQVADILTKPLGKVKFLAF
eukprot:PITA_21066